jgi:carboxynorspermidine decarboxylase
MYKIDPDLIPSPCFVLEEELLEKNLELLAQIKQSSGLTILCALKAFSMYHVFPLVSKYLDGTTASSLNEALLGQQEFGGQVHAYSPVYLKEDFTQLLDICGHLTFNSLNQWNQYSSQALASDGKSFALRINPQTPVADYDLYNPCSPGSRLGIAPDQLKELPEGITGLHFHTLFEADSSLLELTWRAVEQKFGHLFHKISWINMGGGHAITRRGYDVERLVALVLEIRERYGFEVIIEPGSAVAWQTGYLVSTVEDLVENQGIKTAVLDVSFTAHMPDCLEMPYKPKIWHSQEPAPGQISYRMGGLSCLSGDFMGDYSFEKPLEIGQKIIFDDMIHYTMVKTTTFNGVNLPSIGILKKNGEFQLLKRFGYPEFKSRL